MASAARAVAHVGLTVPDLDAAVAWYRDVIGFVVLGETATVRADDPEAGPGAVDVFGPGFREARIATLGSANGTGLELFEFVDPPVEEGDPFTWWRTGLSHLCVVAPDIDALSARIGASGGRVMNDRIWRLRSGQPFRFVYCRDPFGNALELHSHAFDEVFSPRPR